MNDKIKTIVTVRFPSWGENNQYPAFGIKYLVEMPISIMDDENFSFDEEFIKIWKEKIGRDGKEFNGEILFVEETELVIL